MSSALRAGGRRIESWSARNFCQHAGRKGKQCAGAETRKGKSRGCRKLTALDREKATPLTYIDAHPLSDSHKESIILLLVQKAQKLDKKLPLQPSISLYKIMRSDALQKSQEKNHQDFRSIKAAAALEQPKCHQRRY